MGFKTREKGRERWISGDVRWKTVPQTNGHNRKHSVAACGLARPKAAYDGGFGL